MMTFIVFRFNLHVAYTLYCILFNARNATLLMQGNNHIFKPKCNFVASRYLDEYMLAGYPTLLVFRGNKLTKRISGPTYVFQTSVSMVL